MKRKSVIIILVLVILGLGGYIIYDKLNNNEFNLSNKTEIQVLTGPYYTLYVTKQGEAYLTFSEFQTENEFAKTIETLKTKYQSNQIDGYCNAKGDMATQVCPNGNEVSSIKLDVNNIMAAYSLELGQNISDHSIGLIKLDGTVSIINIGEVLEGKQMQVTNNVGNLQNVVSIVKSLTTIDENGTGNTMIAIEKNGTQHDLKKILEKTA